MIDRVNTTGTTWLGLTLGCCQCHSPKYDPVSQHEYYSLAAFFDSIDENGQAGRAAKPYLAVESPHVARAVAEAEALVAARKPAHDAARKAAEQPFGVAEPDGQLEVVPGRAHGGRDERAIEVDGQRLLDDQFVGVAQRTAATPPRREHLSRTARSHSAKLPRSPRRPFLRALGSPNARPHARPTTQKGGKAEGGGRGAGGRGQRAEGRGQENGEGPGGEAGPFATRGAEPRLSGWDR